MNGNEDDEGVFLHVPARHLRGAPTARWRAARDLPSRDAIMSLTLDEEPLAWVRIDSWWDQMWVLKADVSAPSPSPLPPVTSSHIERVRREAAASHEPEARASREAWTRDIARQFGDAARYHMLWEGRWSLAPTQDYAGRFTRRSAEDIAQYIQELQAPGYEVFNRDMPFPWPMRIASDPDSGRMKWWRKMARRDTLPPVLCMRVEPLLADVILDGHDRMLAALLEGKTPDFIRLYYLSHEVWPEAQRVELQERITQEHGYMQGANLSQRTIELLNRRAREAYGDGFYRSSMRAWPLHGGIQMWRAQVTARGALLPAEYAELIAEMLQDPQEPVVEELVYRREPGE